MKSNSAIFINTLFILILSCFVHPIYAEQSIGTFKFRGLIIKNTCVIDADSQTQNIILEQVSKNDFYRNGGVSSFKNFSIGLQECDTSISNAIKLKFTGTTDDELKDALKNTGGTASGVTVMVYYADNGQKIGLNQDSQSLRELSIQDGTNRFEFKAHLQAKPSALSNQSITSGTVKAIMEFTVEYL